MLNLRSILVFSENPSKLTEFYGKIFQMEPNWTEGNFVGFGVGDSEIAFGPHDNVHGKNPNPERMMFNIETDDVQGEFERIKGLGATVITEPYHPGEEPDMWVSTFADPDGNYFQVVSPWETKNAE